MEKRPSEYLFQVVTAVSALERNRSDQWYAMSRNLMRQKLADHVVNMKVEEKHDKYHSEYRLEVVVMTRGELYELINQEAEKLAMRYGNPLDMGKDS